MDLLPYTQVTSCIKSFLTERLEGHCSCGLSGVYTPANDNSGPAVHEMRRCRNDKADERCGKSQGASTSGLGVQAWQQSGGGMHLLLPRVAWMEDGAWTEDGRPSPAAGEVKCSHRLARVHGAQIPDARVILLVTCMFNYTGPANPRGPSNGTYQSR
ncbi:hypothetical protein BS50DRAFT_109255 [Corynespora cassiicola Philippines]|uniref:Uncharacterized protein n=1 Tax=Corynespora cassiicola Philippines TaxID=1448308 RepID=A0A2T2NE32_CORCC|nr:hypothetical protein BS50DRAFT_109255 [Corynespora cassiicola Philippines]